MAPIGVLMVLGLGCGASMRPAQATNEVDLDGPDLTRSLPGTVRAEHGTLVATVCEDVEGGRAGYAGSCRAPVDEVGRVTWNRGDTVLAASSLEAGEHQATGGYFGSVLPWAPDAGVAVRSWTVAWGVTGLGDRSDELVVISLPDVAVRPIYAPGARLRLLSVIAGNAIVLVSSADGVHVIAAVDATGHEVARTEAIEVPSRVLDASPTELGVPWIAPMGPRTLVLACAPSETLCAVRFDGHTLQVTVLDRQLEGRLVVTEGEVWTVRDEQCRPIASDDEPRPCAALEETFDYGDLSVDGRPDEGASGALAARVVRSTLDLDRVPSSGADVVILRAPEGGETMVEFDLWVRGDHLAISYTRGEEVIVTGRDRALALPAGAVTAIPTDWSGAAGLRVHIRTTFPIHYSHGCWEGGWVIRAWDDAGSEAIATRYAEYGYCE